MENKETYKPTYEELMIKLGETVMANIDLRNKVMDLEYELTLIKESLKDKNV